MKTLVIDGNSIINRAFYGIRLLSTKEGIYTNALYGFLSTYLKLLEEVKPQKTIVCFDRREKTFRHEAYSEYKAQRTGMPDELAMQMPLLKELLDAMGVTRCELAGYEADDLIGTFAKQIGDKGEDCVIVTGDKDSLQLVNDRVTVKLVSTRMGQTTTKDVTPQAFFEEYGFEPIKMIDLKALMGDKSDNIPGVAGVGAKTASQLLLDFGSLEGVYENIDSDKIKKGAREKLIANKEMAEKSFWLATICCEVPMDLPTEEKTMDSTALYALLLKYEFKNFIQKMGLSAAAAKGEITAPTIAVAPKKDLTRVDITGEEGLFSLLSTLKGVKNVSLIATQSLEALALLSSGSIYIMQGSYFENEAWDKALAALFGGEIKLIVHDSKPLVAALFEKNIDCHEAFSLDVHLAAYLLDPSAGSYDMATLTLAYLQQELCAPAFEVDDAFSPFGAMDDSIAALVAYVTALDLLAPLLLERVREQEMEKLLLDIEQPLVFVLTAMEQAGFLVDRTALTDFGKELSLRLDQLTAQIYTHAGEEFNINSPKALGVILFEKLGLKTAKKTKTGYSTNIEVLEGLQNDHEMIPLLMEYRQLSKLKSTYSDGLLKVIGLDGRIHTSFQQTVTATGRLSSTEPNLQNIPIRKDLGSLIRKMFIAPEGKVLIDADYSQIELRVLAAIAKDEAMISAFASGEDIHKMTAARVFGVDLADVTPSMRSSAKAVNFGIVYGIGQFSLAGDIGVSVKEAGEYIKTYLEKYSGVAAYMDSIKAFAREHGYVTTLFGRRRYLPELVSKNFNIRAFGERVAMNAPIQGTAADIIKIAMIQVYKRLKLEKLNARLLLQVHDELILEADADLAETVKALLTEEMEAACALAVPMQAEAGAGKSWYEAK